MIALVLLDEVAQTFEFNGEIDVVNDDFFWDLEDGGCEIEDGLDAIGDEPVGNFLRNGSGNGEDGDSDIFLSDKRADFSHAEDLNAEVTGALSGGVSVESGDDLESFAREAAVSEEGAAEVTSADEDDGLEAGGSENIGEFFGQGGDGIAEAAGSEVADVGEIFPELGGLDAGGAGEGDGGDGVNAVGAEALEGAVVDGHPVDGLFRDGLPLRCAGHCSESL